MSEMANNTRKMKNMILAIDAAPAAIPPKPNIAATMATTKNIKAQYNMGSSFRLPDGWY
jgi:hypothetical protein